METDKNAPCQACGSPVRVRRRAGEMSIADAAPPVIEERVCTNRNCPTNSAEKSITDVV